MVDLQAALTKLQKKYPDVPIGSLSEFGMTHEAFPTGNLVLDSITGIGGFPRGRITELRGASQSGKTTSAIMAAANHQRRVRDGKDSGAILYLDFENALDESYAQALGLDTEDKETFLVMQPDFIEQGANAFRALLNEGLVAYCIFDSVAAAISEAELEKETGAAVVADRAKILHQFFRQVTSPLKKHRAGLILINHEMTEIPKNTFAASFGPKKKSPGGTSIEFYASMRISFEQVKMVRTNEVNPFSKTELSQNTATDIKATVFKNKQARPQQFGFMRIFYGMGFSQGYSVLNTLVAYKVVKKKPAGVFIFPDHLMPSDGEIPQGELKVVQKMEKDRDWLTRLEDSAKLEIENFVKPDSDETIDLETGEIIE